MKAGKVGIFFQNNAGALVVKTWPKSCLVFCLSGTHEAFGGRPSGVYAKGLSLCLPASLSNFVSRGFPIVPIATTRFHISGPPPMHKPVAFSVNTIIPSSKTLHRYSLCTCPHTHTPSLPIHAFCPCNPSHLTRPSLICTHASTHHRVRGESAMHHLPADPDREMGHDVRLHQVLQSRGRTLLHLRRRRFDFLKSGGGVRLVYRQVHRYKGLAAGKSAGRKGTGKGDRRRPG